MAPPPRLELSDRGETGLHIAAARDDDGREAVGCVRLRRLLNRAARAGELAGGLVIVVKTARSARDLNWTAAG